MISVIVSGDLKINVIMSGNLKMSIRAVTAHWVDRHIFYCKDIIQVTNNSAIEKF